MGRVYVVNSEICKTDYTIETFKTLGWKLVELTERISANESCENEALKRFHKYNRLIFVREK